jgi:transmembrane sensor
MTAARVGFALRRPFSSSPLAILAVLGTLATPLGIAILTSPARASELITDVGEFRVERLSEGLTIHLNTSTRVRVSHGRASTGIELVSGEVYVEVGPGTTGRVDLGGGSFVSGTGKSRVNVKRDTTGVTVAVVEGAAAVRSSRRNEATMNLAESEEMTFKSGGTFAGSTRRIISTVELMRRTAWTQGRLWFEGEPLREVVAQMNRFNKRKIVIADVAIESISIGGVFRPTDIDNFLRALAPLGVRAAGTPQARDGGKVIQLVARTE